MNPFISVTIYLCAQFLTLRVVLREPAGLLRDRSCAKYLPVPALTLWCLLMLLPVAGTFLPKSGAKYLVQAAGDIWLGFYIYFIMSFLLLKAADALRVHLSAGGRAPLPGSRFILPLSVLAGLAVLAFGMIHAQHTRVTRCEVTLDKPLAGDNGGSLKLVLIADLHLSVNSHPGTIRRMVGLINEEDPDIVLIAGDFFTSSYETLRHPEEYAEALRGIRPRYGVYAVYGNHDVEESLFGGFPISPIRKAFRSPEMERFIKSCGFTVLYDEITETADGAVQIAGRVDGEKAGDGTKKRMSPSALLASADPAKPVIVLQHEPVEFSDLKKAGADLALCGHTHAGQIFPGNLIVPFFNENAYGFRTVGGLDTIVTSGIGYYGPPMRVGTDSEIMVITLKGTGSG